MIGVIGVIGVIGTLLIAIILASVALGFSIASTRRS